MEKRKGFAALGIGLAACFLGTLCFPWDSILKWSGLMSSLVSMIQSPWHFLQTALLAFSVLGCLTYQMAKKKYGDFYGKIYGLGLAGCGCFCSSYLAANLLFYYDFVRVETGEELWVPLAGEGKEAPLPVLASGLQLNGADGIWYALTAVSILAFAGCVVFILRDRQKQ